MAESQRRVLQDVSVIIPTLGRGMLEGCLNSIVSGTAHPHRIILIDQGNNARVTDWVMHVASAGIRVSHIQMSTKGIALGMNRGLKAVQTKIAVVTHDDCEVGQDWLERMANRVRKNPHAIVTGRVEPGRSDTGCDGIVPIVNRSMISAIYTRPLFTDNVLFPNNMGFMISIFNEIGPFDENPLFAMAAEDNDWQYRALRSGIPIVYAPEVVVDHLDWRDKAKREAAYRIYFRSQGALYGKYLQRGDLFMAVRAAIDVIRGLRRWLCGLASGDGEMYVSGRAKTTQLLPGILDWFRSKST